MRHILTVLILLVTFILHTTSDLQYTKFKDFFNFYHSRNVVYHPELQLAILYGPGSYNTTIYRTYDYQLVNRTEYDQFYFFMPNYAEYFNNGSYQNLIYSNR